MLLVKSRESKNSSKSRAQSLLGLISCIATPAFAQSQNSGSGQHFTTILLSLLIVVGVILALAYVMRRFNVTHTGGGDLKAVASMMVGTRERIMVVQVGAEQHMLGVTATQINHLAKLDAPIAAKSAATGEQFKSKLAHFINKQRQDSDS